jgi:hypothetical protein
MSSQFVKARSVCGGSQGEEFYMFMSRGSSGSIVSDYGLDDRGSIPDRGRFFF